MDQFNVKSEHEAINPAEQIRPVRDDPAAGCAAEPVHRPGSIQPHGHLLGFDPDTLLLLHVSAAAAPLLAMQPVAALGRSFDDVLRCEPRDMLRDALARHDGPEAVQLGACRAADGTSFHVVAHRSPDGVAVLEFERPTPGDPESATLEALYPGIREAFSGLSRGVSAEALGAVAAGAIRRITGFDRVLVYRFEENWDGVVVAEDRNDRLPSYLGLRFPASDIPAQARSLYERAPVRLIANVDYLPVPILPAAPGATLDLSFSVLRSVSPVHLEYMRNMDTPASMSVSILRSDGRLWGLLSCHHAAPWRAPVAARNACNLIGGILGMRLAALEETGRAAQRSRLKGIEGRMLASMAACRDVAKGLDAARADLLALTGAGGAAVVADGHCLLVGRTPPEAEVRRIADWLAARGVEDVLETTCLSALLPGALSHAEVASGLLAIPISRLHASFLIWFRPEQARTITWGGDPRKLPDETGRLNPRRSFAAWVETVRLRAAPWQPAEVEAARELRGAIVSIVLRAAEERAALTGRLEAVNSELAAFSYSISHDLRAPFRHIAGYAELLRELEAANLSEKGQRFLGTITEAAQTAGRLVDALLEFSQMGRSAMAEVAFDPLELIASVQAMLARDTAGRALEWRIGPLPLVRGDPTLLRQVFQNLLGNAVKYTRGRDPAVIEVTAAEEAAEIVFRVSDNGAGFDMAYAHKLFGVFQRLHRAEEFDGIGIGLAIARRIVERHGGRIWAVGEPGRGASFLFALPRPVGQSGE